MFRIVWKVDLNHISTEGKGLPKPSVFFSFLSSSFFFFNFFLLVKNFRKVGPPLTEIPGSAPENPTCPWQGCQTVGQTFNRLCWPKIDDKKITPNFSKKSKHTKQIVTKSCFWLSEMIPKSIHVSNSVLKKANNSCNGHSAADGKRRC